MRHSSFGSSGDFFVFTSIPFFSSFGTDSGTGNVVCTIGTASSIASASVFRADEITGFVSCDVTGVTLIFSNLASSSTSKLVVDIDACVGDDGSLEDIITLKQTEYIFNTVHPILLKARKEVLF